MSNDTKAKYHNPSGFIMKYDAPFNFGMTVADYDEFFHDPQMPSGLKKNDPCDWTEEQKLAVEGEAKMWMEKWNAYCAGELD